MPEIRLTDSQKDRFDALREELAAEHAGRYASVGADDAMEYLLDLADVVEDPDRSADFAIGTGDEDADAGEGSDSDEGAADGGDGADEDGGKHDEEDDGRLDAMLGLLETHDDKWREVEGDARYEVDLPDGSVETARTKDDVRAILFRNY